MTTAVSCRGCGSRVSLTAEFCIICKCPGPACHLSHLLPENGPLQHRDLSSAASARSWQKLALGAVGLIGVAALAAAARLALAR